MRSAECLSSHPFIYICSGWSNVYVASFVVCIVGNLVQVGSRNGVKVLWCHSHLVFALYHLTLAVVVFIMCFVSAAAFLPCHSKLSRPVLCFRV